jgi:hypothetical protein
LLFFNFFK